MPIKFFCAPGGIQLEASRISAGFSPPVIFPTKAWRRHLIFLGCWGTVSYVSSGIEPTLIFLMLSACTYPRLPRIAAAVTADIILEAIAAMQADM